MSLDLRVTGERVILMRLSVYLKKVDGILLSYGDVVSRTSGEVLCDASYTSAMEVAGAIAGGTEIGCECEVVWKPNSSMTIIRFSENGTQYTVPDNALIPTLTISA